MFALGQSQSGVKSHPIFSAAKISTMAGRTLQLHVRLSRPNSLVRVTEQRSSRRFAHERSATRKQGCISPLCRLVGSNARTAEVKAGADKRLARKIAAIWTWTALVDKRGVPPTPNDKVLSWPAVRDFPPGAHCEEPSAPSTPSIRPLSAGSS